MLYPNFSNYPKKPYHCRPLMPKKDPERKRTRKKDKVLALRCRRKNYSSKFYGILDFPFRATKETLHNPALPRATNSTSPIDLK